jgi:hypothetical protein
MFISCSDRAAFISIPRREEFIGSSRLDPIDAGDGLPDCAFMWFLTPVETADRIISIVSGTGAASVPTVSTTLLDRGSGVSDLPIATPLRKSMTSVFENVAFADDKSWGVVVFVVATARGLIDILTLTVLTAVG